MAKIKKNAIMQGLSGSVGGLVFRQMSDGSIRVSAKPDFSHRKFSQGQKDHQSRFKQAVAYAREAAKTQPIYAELAQGTTKNAYNWALSDWFNPPVIHRIERIESRIRVDARDNVLVTRVRVTIVNADGEVLESGDASQVDTDWWEYPVSTEGIIEAVAWDMAGNKTKAVL